MSSHIKADCMLKELAAVFDVVAHFSLRPWMRLLPKGDGHPVLIIPGFMASSALTAQMREVLSRLGYDVHDWGQGTNFGYSAEKIDNLIQMIEDLHQQSGQKVSIVGWSLGGLYGRALANINPGPVNQVITLGSPYRIPVDTLKDKPDSIIIKAYQAINPDVESMSDISHLWSEHTSVPTTSIYTKTDGIVHWTYCREEERRLSENIEIKSTHAGLMHNPRALFVVANRLLQKRESWERYADAPKNWLTFKVAKPESAESHEAVLKPLQSA